MNTNKRLAYVGLAAVTAVFMGTSALVLAEEPTTPSGQKEEKQATGPCKTRWLEKLTKELDLTKEQQAKVKEALDIQKEQITAVKNDNSLDQQAKKTRMKEITSKSRESIKALLTSEQTAIYDEMHKKHKNHKVKDNNCNGSKTSGT
jgi:Spy/CpxP family protein refolding chaperone